LLQLRFPCSKGLPEHSFAEVAPSSLSCLLVGDSTTIHWGFIYSIWISNLLVMEKDTIYTVLPRNWRIPKINCMYIYIYITIYGWLFFASSFGYPKPQLGRCPLSKSSAGLHVRRGTQAGQPGIFTSPWSFRTALGARAIFIGRGHEGPKVLAILREENMRKTRFTDVYTMTHSWLRGLNGLNIKITNGGQLLMRTHPILGTNHDKNIC